MEFLTDFFYKLRHLDELIRWGGYAGLSIIIFAETGLLIGFFLPGDSLLVTAGLLASQGLLDIVYLNFLLIAMAIIGDSVGYYIGYKSGPKIFNRKDSLLFKKEHLIKTHQFYEKHGGKTIVIARFIPIIRTFAPVIAGVAQMNYKRFIFFNVFGGIGWIFSMTMIGYWLGRLVPNIEKHIDWVIIIVIFLSILPGIYHYYKERRATAVKP